MAGLLPGLGLVLTGQIGTGRTVLSLQVAACAVQRGERVALLTAEPPSVLLRQADSLGIDLGPGVETGRLVLLEMVADVAGVVRSYGLPPLLEALVAEVPEADLWVIDPLTALTQDLLDEKPMRAGITALLGAPPGSRRTTVVTADATALRKQPALERALSDVCGALLYLGRDEFGERSLSVLQCRVGKAAGGRIAFDIGIGGALAKEQTRKEEPRRAAPEAAHATSAPEASALVLEPVRALVPVAAELEPVPMVESRPRVLVVDRDEAARAHVVEGLCDRYDVITASDGFGALSAIMSEHPDAVVLDLLLGDVSGYEVLRALARAPNSPPVLAISDRLARAADRIRALVLGAADVLPKASARFEVRLKVDSLLRNPPPRTRDLDLEIDLAELMLLAASKQRQVGEDEFRTRIERAQRFGDRFGVSSSTIAIETERPEDLDALVGACERTLRAEDAVFPIDEHRALVLAVASGSDRAPLIMSRLRQAGSIAQLSWGVRVISADAAHADWDKYFTEIDRR